jgi:outer membrane protein OmpA-like peptidoglycan-associated protein/opacity protein-like surface antigen
MKAFNGVAIAAALLLPVAVGAEPLAGPYVAGSAGAGLQDSIGIDGAQSLGQQVGTPVLGGGKARISNGIGVAGLLALGNAWQNGVRVELEGSYRLNRASRIREFGQSLSGVSGDTRSLGAAANAYYDLRLGRVAGLEVTSYLGAGLGFGMVNFNRLRGTLAANQTATLLDDGSGVRLAYNAMAGVAVGLTPGLSGTLEFRHHGLLSGGRGATISVTNTATGASQSRIGTVKCCTDNAVLVGLRYSFGDGARPVAAAEVPLPATPVQPAAGAPLPARTYLVFFDFNNATLNQASQQVLREAAESARNGKATRVEVVGRADRAGRAAYNQVLSRQRAEAVAARLVSEGLARSMLAVRAMGESSPLVATADRMQEPRNRVVEIIMR